MSSQPYDLRDASVEGGRVERVVHRPHEVRLYLKRAQTESVWLRFWPAAEVRFELLDDGQSATHLTVDAAGERSRVRVWSGDLMICDVEAPSWSWHPFETDEDEFLWHLDDDEKRAVAVAVEAVLDRDVERVRALAPTNADARFVADFWQWVDTYDDGEPIRLLRPPGPVEDWDGYVIRRPEGTEVGIELLDADRPDHLTDLTLRLDLSRRPDGTVRAVLEDLHVM